MERLQPVLRDLQDALYRNPVNLLRARGFDIKRSFRERFGITNIEHWDAKLCLSCSEALRSNETGVLHMSQQSMERMPGSCPLCALVDLFSSLYPKSFDEVNLILESKKTKPRSYRHKLRLKYYHSGYYVESEHLGLLPVKYNTGLSQNVNIRKLSASTSSSDSINFLKQQLRNCVKYHPACRPTSTTPPTRLLRIGPLLDSSQGSDSNVYLVDGSSSVGHPYFTLSHCWGKAQFLQLTKETEAELRAGIPTGTLPKTFRDAIHVCHQLNQQYLWIDSLCIRQDDKEDWRVEAAKMHQVFANAHCNIAATGAVDSSVGLFFDRNPLAHQPFCIQTGTNGRKKWLCLPDWSEYTLLRSPLNRRAWVAQERFLSSRIVHFTSVGLYWDCNTSKMSELYPTHTPPGGLYDFEPMTTLKSVMGVFAARRTFRSKRPKSETKILFESWRDLVVGYSLCGLTKEEDKLIAFNGICHRMRESVGANIICGMWEDFMIDELQWEVNSTFNRQDAPLIENQRAPSWSWASADHHLQEFSFTSEHYYCKHRKEIAEVAHVEAKTFPTGFVESATLVLRGKVTSAKVRIEELTWRAALPAKASCKSREYEMDSRSFVFDRLPQFPYEEDITLLALSRCFCTRGVFTRPPGAEDLDKDKRVKSSLAVLMLRRSPGNPLTYSRIGLLRLQADDCLMYYDNMSATAEELTLV